LLKGNGRANRGWDDAEMRGSPADFKSAAEPHPKLRGLVVGPKSSAGCFLAKASYIQRGVCR